MLSGNHAIAAAGVTLVVLLAASMVTSTPRDPTPTAPAVVPESAEFIAWRPSELDCVGRANCTSEAIAAYRVGKNLSEHAHADLANQYEAFKRLDRAQRLLALADNATDPQELQDLAALKAEVKVELDRRFRQARLNLRDLHKRNHHRDAVRELDTLKAYFPDPRSLPNRWATAEEQRMRAAGTYPSTFGY